MATLVLTIAVLIVTVKPYLPWLHLAYFGYTYYGCTYDGSPYCGYLHTASDAHQGILTWKAAAALKKAERDARKAE